MRDVCLPLQHLFSFFYVKVTRGSRVCYKLNRIIRLLYLLLQSVLCNVFVVVNIKKNKVH